MTNRKSPSVKGFGAGTNAQGEVTFTTRKRLPSGEIIIVVLTGAEAQRRLAGYVKTRRRMRRLSNPPRKAVSLVQGSLPESNRRRH